MPKWRNLPAGRQVGRQIMFYVYIIKSRDRNYIYIGITNNLDRRLSEHNKGQNKTTKPYKPFTLLYSKKFNTRQDARDKEKYFKSGAGREFIRQNYL